MSRHKHECAECFDPKTLDLIKCVCSLERLVDDVFKCLSCRPSTRRLQQILTCVVLDDVRRIENLLTNETFGLAEIKNEVRQIENTVQAINNILTADLAFISSEIQAANNSLNSSAFGLQRIETDVQTINGNLNNPAFGLRRIETDIQTVNSSVSSPVFGLQKIESEVKAVNDSVNSTVFGLQEIKSEIMDIISSINSPLFGLQEIEKQIRAVENSVVGIYPRLTTGPVFINENARHLIVQMQNNTSEPQTVSVRVMRIDKQPFQEIFNKSLEIPPCATNEFRYIALDSADCCDSTSGEIEVILGNLAAGLYPTMAQLDEDDKIITSSIFRCADFVPKTEDYV